MLKSSLFLELKSPSFHDTRPLGNTADLDTSVLVTNKSISMLSSDDMYNI